MKWRDLLGVLSLSQKYRIVRHVEYLRKHIQIPKGHDKENFDRVYANFTLTAKRLSLYHLARNICFVLLYFSVIATVAKDLAPWAVSLLSPLGALSQLFGISILTLLFLFFSTAAGAVQVDLMLEHSHLISIAVKHNKSFVVHPIYHLGLFKDFD